MMYQLKTVAQQVEEFGTYLRTDTVNNTRIDIYMVDRSTHAHIERDKNGNPKTVTFTSAT